MNLFHSQRKHRFIIGGLLSGVLLLTSCATSTNLRNLDKLQPDPKFSPVEVVQIQMEALQKNDAENKGIEIAFRFASPNNKQATGPLPRFIGMVKGPLYSPMLNFISISYGPLMTGKDRARQSVTITALNGLEITYIFFLSKQPGGEYPDCWMTDSVMIGSIQNQENSVAMGEKLSSTLML